MVTDRVVRNAAQAFLWYRRHLAGLRAFAAGMAAIRKAVLRASCAGAGRARAGNIV